MKKYIALFTIVSFFCVSLSSINITDAELDLLIQYAGTNLEFDLWQFTDSLEEETAFDTDSDYVEEYEEVIGLFNAIVDNKLETVEQLISNGIDVNTKDNEGTTPLMIAAAEGRVAIAQCLLAHGADVNAQTNDNMQAINFVIDSLFYGDDNIQMLNLLVSHGAIIPYTDILFALKHKFFTLALRLLKAKI